MLAATSNFLLPSWTIIPEFVAFVVVLWVLAKKVLPPISRAMTARQEKIADSLRVIEEADARHAATEAEAHAVLEEARQRARAVLESAERTSEEIQAEARQRGEEEYARLVGRAAAEIERSRAQAEVSLLGELSDLVVAAAEKVVEAEIDPARHRVLIDEAIDAARGVAAEVR